MSNGINQDGEKNNLLIDAAVLAESLGIKVEQVYKFTQLFIQTAKEEFNALETAINAQDLSLIAMIGHRLKSSSSTVGANLFAEQCRILESFKNGGDVSQARDIFAKLQFMLEAIENDHEKRIK